MNATWDRRPLWGRQRHRVRWAMGVAAAITIAGVAAYQAGQARRNERLVQAVTKNDVAGATRLLSEGAAPDARYLFAFDLPSGYRYQPTGKRRVEHWRPLLILAVQRGQFTLVKALLEHGADPGAVDESGRSALMHALIYDRRQLVKLLLDRGAAVHATDRAGNSALIYAALAENTAAIRLLRSHGAALDAGAENGQTALMLAAREGKGAAVRALLELGADARLRDWYGRTAEDLARKNGHSEIAGMLRRVGSGRETGSRAGQSRG